MISNNIINKSNLPSLTPLTPLDYFNHGKDVYVFLSERGFHDKDIENILQYVLNTILITSNK